MSLNQRNPPLVPSKVASSACKASAKTRHDQDCSDRSLATAADIFLVKVTYRKKCH